MRVRSSFVSARGVGSEAGSIVLDECCRGDGLRALRSDQPRSPFAKCKCEPAARHVCLRFARFCPRVARFQLKFHNDPYKPRNTGLVCTWSSLSATDYELASDVRERARPCVRAGASRSPFFAKSKRTRAFNAKTVRSGRKRNVQCRWLRRRKERPPDRRGAHGAEGENAGVIFQISSRIITTHEIMTN